MLKLLEAVPLNASSAPGGIYSGDPFDGAKAALTAMQVADVGAAGSAGTPREQADAAVEALRSAESDLVAARDALTVVRERHRELNTHGAARLEIIEFEIAVLVADDAMRIAREHAVDALDRAERHEEDEHALMCSLPLFHAGLAARWNVESNLRAKLQAAERATADFLRRAGEAERAWAMRREESGLPVPRRIPEPLVTLLAANENGMLIEAGATTLLIALDQRVAEGPIPFMSHAERVKALREEEIVVMANLEREHRAREERSAAEARAAEEAAAERERNAERARAEHEAQRERDAAARREMQALADAHRARTRNTHPNESDHR